MYFNTLFLGTLSNLTVLRYSTQFWELSDRIGIVDIRRIIIAYTRCLQVHSRKDFKKNISIMHNLCSINHYSMTGFRQSWKVLRKQCRISKTYIFSVVLSFGQDSRFGESCRFRIISLDILPREKLSCNSKLWLNLLWRPGPKLFNSRQVHSAFAEIKNFSFQIIYRFASCKLFKCILYIYICAGWSTSKNRLKEGDC